jgi:hypothetical protein
VEGATAFVSIMEGCSKYCSYCVVPYTRGEEVSRPFDDVLVEVAGLADQGVKEVTLLGQNVNAYRGKMGGTAEIADFALLIEYVAEIPGIERIRYTTSHPNEFTQRLIEAYAKVPQLVSHLHLPVQHGSDRILMAMKRGYTAMEYKSTVRKLRAIRPDLALSSDFIVGFPGETEDDFAKMMKLIDDVGFDSSFSFIFSPRPGTPAAALHDDTPHEVKLAPAAPAGRDRRERARHQRQPLVGTVQRILVEGASRKDAERADGPHRVQPRRQLRGRRPPGRPDDRPAHHCARARPSRWPSAARPWSAPGASRWCSTTRCCGALRRRRARGAPGAGAGLEKNGLAPPGIEMWRAQLGVIEGLMSGNADSALDARSTMAMQFRELDALNTNLAQQAQFLIETQNDALAKRIENARRRLMREVVGPACWRCAGAGLRHLARAPVQAAGKRHRRPGREPARRGDRHPRPGRRAARVAAARMAAPAPDRAGRRQGALSAPRVARAQDAAGRAARRRVAAGRRRDRRAEPGNDQLEVAQILQQNTVSLQGQIEALLRFNAAAFEARELRRERTELLPLIEEQIEAQRLQWQSHGLRVRAEGEPLASRSTAPSSAPPLPTCCPTRSAFR